MADGVVIYGAEVRRNSGRTLSCTTFNSELLVSWLTDSVAAMSDDGLTGYDSVTVRFYGPYPLHVYRFESPEDATRFLSALPEPEPF